MVGLIGDSHIQDRVCKGCSHNWRMVEKNGESEFVIVSNALTRKHGAAVAF